VPPLPPAIEWIGKPIGSIEPLLAQRPALVHFFDFAQLNSARTLPYLRAWHERYTDAGLAVLGVHSPRFPFTRSAESVAEALPRLEIEWPVAIDAEMTIWRSYEPHGWPAVFLWGKGGALRWYQLGEGEYAATEEAIRDALADAGAERDWPPPLEPLRATDGPGVKVIAPTPELFPGGTIERPWSSGDSGPLQLDYEAGGAYAATDGAGEIAIRLDGEQVEPVKVDHPGLQELTTHPTTERHALELEPSAGVEIYSLQFAAGVPG
jgi:hypothetical protein